MIQAVVGAGGKTTYIKKQADFWLKQGKKVFVTTSTHMFIEKDTLLTDDADEIIRELETKGYVMAGIPEGKKIRSLSMDSYEKVCAHADVVLVEADGSKGMPVKIPVSHEPVIYSNTDEIVVICGLHAIGKTFESAAHRVEDVLNCLNSGDGNRDEKAELAQKSEAVEKVHAAQKSEAVEKVHAAQMPENMIQKPGITRETQITAEHIQKLVRKGYVKPLAKEFPDKKIKIRASHDNSLYQKVFAHLLEADMDVSMIKKEWFTSQPKLIVCGGGHVATELVKMASCLDFYIKVIDDREEFANQERFPMADEVICDHFKNLDNYLEPDGYYVVVTRGHAADYECVKTILNSRSYDYLGMIGSKIKVKTCVEKLTEEGYSEEEIHRIFAPIGLKIKAKTPAEIAVSILAEIIQEKNSKTSSTVSRELLEVQEPGALCIIIEKSGSSPRGEGSMMFVGEEGTIDSIGGGPVEYAAIRDAAKITQASVKEYHLNNKDSERLGMICGGSNKVLFIPLNGFADKKKDG